MDDMPPLTTCDDSSSDEDEDDEDSQDLKVFDIDKIKKAVLGGMQNDCSVEELAAFITNTKTKICQSHREREKAIKKQFDDTLESF